RYIAKFIKTNIIARQSPFVDKYAIIGAGIVKGVTTETLATKFKFIAIYVIVVVTTGPNTNGIAKIGFNTIGAPKIIGSFMLKRPGIIATFPICFIYSDLLNKNNKQTTTVAPYQAIHINKTKYPSVPISGIGSHSASTVIFCSKRTNQIGRIKDPTTETP